ncbi:MAG: VOC family protein [Patescibacteria group bacterium]
MTQNPIGWFEIPVSDLDRATKFYEHVLEISMKREDIPGWKTSWFPSNDEGRGASGVLMQGDGYHPGATGPVMYFTCPDIEAAIARAEELGSKVMVGKKDIGEWGYIAWIFDSEGNIMALHTRK